MTDFYCSREELLEKYGSWRDYLPVAERIAIAILGVGLMKAYRDKVIDKEERARLEEHIRGLVEKERIAPVHRALGDKTAAARAEFELIKSASVAIKIGSLMARQEKTADAAGRILGMTARAVAPAVKKAPGVVATNLRRTTQIMHGPPPGMPKPVNLPAPKAPLRRATVMQAPAAPQLAESRAQTNFKRLQPMLNPGNTAGPITQHIGGVPQQIGRKATVAPPRRAVAGAQPPAPHPAYAAPQQQAVNVPRAKAPAARPNTHFMSGTGAPPVAPRSGAVLNDTGPGLKPTPGVKAPQQTQNFVDPAKLQKGPPQPPTVPTTPGNNPTPTPQQPPGKEKGLIPWGHVLGGAALYGGYKAFTGALNTGAGLMGSPAHGNMNYGTVNAPMMASNVGGGYSQSIG